MGIKSLRDVSILWNSTSLRNKMHWLSNAQVSERKIPEYAVLEWKKLPEKIKDMLRFIK